MKRALSFLVWIRRSLEVALILGVVIVILHSQKPVVSTASAALLDEVWDEEAPGFQRRELTVKHFEITRFTPKPQWVSRNVAYGGIDPS